MINVDGQGEGGFPERFGMSVEYPWDISGEHETFPVQGKEIVGGESGRRKEGKKERRKKEGRKEGRKEEEREREGF